MDIVSFIGGIIASIIASIIIEVVRYIYIGGKSFVGCKKALRLVADASNGGINNLFISRKSYITHKDHGTSIEYISKAKRSIYYVGFWFANGTEIGHISDGIKKLIYEKNLKVTIVFINPNAEGVIEDCSKFLGIGKVEIKKRVNFSLEKFINIYNSLDGEYKDKLSIRIHNVPLSASAFVLDSEVESNCKVLVDYKIYNCTREDSYGIEYRNSKKALCKNIAKSYIDIANTAKEIKSIKEVQSDNLKIEDNNELINNTKRVLWIDDYPINNENILDLFIPKGIIFHNVVSTSEGIEMYKKYNYDLIITDMGREHEYDAGETIIKRIQGLREVDKLQRQETEKCITPIVVFTSKSAYEKYYDKLISYDIKLITYEEEDIINELVSLLKQ